MAAAPRKTQEKLTGALHARRAPTLAFVDDDIAPWVTSPDGAWPSLELIDPNLDNGLAASWAAGQLYSPETLNNPDVDGQGGVVNGNFLYTKIEARSLTLHTQGAAEFPTGLPIGAFCWHFKSWHFDCVKPLENLASLHFIFWWSGSLTLNWTF